MCVNSIQMRFYGRQTWSKEKKKKPTISQSSSLAIGLLNLWQPSLLLNSEANLQIPQWGIACTSLHAPACGQLPRCTVCACHLWDDKGILVGKPEWKYLHWHYSFAEGKYQRVCGGGWFVQLRRQGEVLSVVFYALILQRFEWRWAAEQDFEAGLRFGSVLWFIFTAVAPLMSLSTWGFQITKQVSTKA